MTLREQIEAIERQQDVAERLVATLTASQTAQAQQELLAAEELADDAIELAEQLANEDAALWTASAIQTHIQKAHVLHTQGRDDAAVPVLEAALARAMKHRLHAETAQVLQGLALSQAELGHLDPATRRAEAAVRILERLTRRDEQHARDLHRARLNAAMILVQDDRPDEAEWLCREAHDFAESRNADPEWRLDQATAMGAAGSCWMMRNPPRCVALTERAMALSDGDACLQDALRLQLRMARAMPERGWANLF